jgi:hypothetical protein
MNFARARFMDEADFENRCFQTSVSFERAYFHVAPNFLGCRFPENVNFHGVRFNRNARPKSAESKYRFLRRKMRELGARDYEGLFYTLEQKCRAKKYPWIARIPFWFYDLTSGYGRSYERAILTLGAVQIIAFSFYHLLAYGFTLRLGAEWKDIAYFTVAQVLRPFELFTSGAEVPEWFARNASNYGLSTIAYTAGFQSLLSIGIFALLLLAIRWRFKRD